MSEPENMRGTRNTNTRPSTDTPSQTPNARKTSSNQNQNHTPSTNPTQPSLADRIQNSASGLARSAFTVKGDSSAAQALAGATNGKGAGAAGSGSGSGTGYAASRDVGLSSGSSSSEAGAARQGTSGFRETNGSQLQGGFEIPALSQEEFQQEHGFDLGEASARSSGSLQSDGGSWKGKQRARDPVQGEYSTAWERANTSTQPGAEADGAAVVSLLSDTSFDAGFSGDPGADALEVDFDPYAAPPPLTADEIKFLDSFRRQISEHDSVQTGAPLSSRSLVPDIDTFLQQNDPAGYVQAKGQSVSGSDVSLRDDVLSNLPGSGDWIDVQERYHDEVWGYLRPALEAAKSEIDAQGQEHDEDGPAVRRLKMILRHMKT